MTKERPIILSASEVRAVLDGRMTQVRRVVKPQPPAGVALVMPSGNPVFLEWGRAQPKQLFHIENGVRESTAAPMDPQPKCPYGRPGDTLWVREAFSPSVCETCDYMADYSDPKGLGWEPSSRMPRWASRITLAVENVRVERVRDISEDDAMASGIVPIRVNGCVMYAWSGAIKRGGAVDAVDIEFIAVNAKEAFQTYWTRKHGPESWDRDWVWVGTFRKDENQ